jgi:hypothetical protein
LARRSSLRDRTARITPTVASETISQTTSFQFPITARIEATAGGPNSIPVLVPMTISPFMVPIWDGDGV